MAPKSLTGGCLCGATRYRTSGPPFAADYCHCAACRKSAGAPVAAWMDFSTKDVRWLGEPPREYASSASVRRGFCPTCGATLSYRHVEHPEYLTLAIGSLDDPAAVRPTYHVFTEEQVAWLELADDGRRFPRGLEEGPA